MQRALLQKILLVAVVALLLQIPVGMIRGLVMERRQARDGVIADIARGSSDAQKVIGPLLYVPWTRRSVEAIVTTDDAGHSRTTRKERVERGHAAFLPGRLEIDGRIDLQRKHRGIYEARLFTLHATLKGEFTVPPGFGVPEGAGSLEWGRAALVLGLQDPRGIRGPIRVEWDGTHPTLSPGGIEASGAPNGVQADLGVLAPPREPGLHAFSVALELLGTERLEIVPVGASTMVSLASDWPHPSFGGRLLPDAGGDLSPSGFRARWQTTHFANNLAQLHQRCVQGRQCDPFHQHTLAVSFMQPVDLYLTVERSVKYGFLFIGLTFAAFFLYEVLRRLAIHPVQYGLVGVALALFFLLLISLSEHLGFGPAYAIAATACVTLIGYYVGQVLRSVRQGLLFALALAGLYGLMYVLLRSEDHALLFGSVFVFACVAAVMIATRRVNWYDLAAVRPARVDTDAAKPA